MVLMNNEFYGIWKEAVMTKTGQRTRIYAKRLKKPQNLREDMTWQSFEVGISRDTICSVTATLTCSTWYG